MLIGAEFHCLDLPINVLSPKGLNREAQGNALGRRYEGVFQAEGLRQGTMDGISHYANLEWEAMVRGS
jgi:hypothetical protein